MPTHRRFIDRVHRRAAAWSAAEGAAIGLAVGAGAAGLLGAVARAEWLSAGPWFAGCGIVAAAIGGAAGFRRRPSRLKAAAMADQQFRLADVLSSALLTKADDFGAIVHAAADAAVAGRSPGDVLLRRLSGRAWGGVALAWAAAGTIVLLVGPATPLRAANRWANQPPSVAVAHQPAEPEQARASIARSRAIGHGEAASDAFSQIGRPQDASGAPAGSSAHDSAATSGEESAATDRAGAANKSGTAPGSGASTATSINPRDLAANTTGADHSTAVSRLPTPPQNSSAASSVSTTDGSGASVDRPDSIRPAADQPPADPNHVLASVEHARVGGGAFDRTLPTPAASVPRPADDAPAAPSTVRAPDFFAMPDGRPPAGYDDLIRDFFSQSTLADHR